MLALSREIISSVVVGRFVVAVSFVRCLEILAHTTASGLDTGAMEGFRGRICTRWGREERNTGITERRGSWMRLLGQESCALFFCTVPSGGDGMRF